MQKSGYQLLQFSIAIFVLMSIPSCAPIPEYKDQLVRLAVIEVDNTQVEKYNQYLKEEVEASIEKEPGVLTLYAVAETENPQHITLFETYADSTQYKAHLATPHFQKYKQGTLEMVKGLSLIESRPILYHRKAELSKAPAEDLFLRLIKMQIHAKEIDRFKALAENVMLPGLKGEPGVLVMYAVAKKDDPTQITILEVYANADAYQHHVKTSHFLKYKEDSKDMITSLKLIDVRPIQLGSKQQ